MAGKTLYELKVSELKKELEERDLDTTGNKAALQQRLSGALKDDGEDPETYCFESAVNINELFRTMTGNLKEELADSSKALKQEFLESSRTLKEELSENTRNIEIKLMENSKAVELKINEYTAQIEKNLEEIRDQVDTVEKKFQGEVETIMKKIQDLEVKTNEHKVVSSLPETVPLVTESSMIPEVKPVVTYTGRNEIPTFDGKTPWEEFLTLFETAAMINGWSDAAKAATLSLALRGDALRVLQTIPLAERQNFHEIISRLEMRFGHSHMDQVYRSQLRNRYQKPQESLQEFEADIARLVRSAYPTASDDVYESLAVENFLVGLRDCDTQQAVKLGRPKTLRDALTHALEFEAVKQSVRQHARVRALNGIEEEQSQPSIEDIVEKLLEAIKLKRPERRCWNCGEKGHLRNRCPKPQRVQTSSEN